jgi:hypothetical protein
MLCGSRYSLSGTVLANYGLMTRPPCSVDHVVDYVISGAQVFFQQDTVGPYGLRTVLYSTAGVVLDRVPRP